jgi:hypothetical protein
MSPSNAAQGAADPVFLAEKATTEGAYLTGGRFGQQVRHWFILPDSQVIVVVGDGNPQGFVSSIEEMLRCFKLIEKPV